MPPRRILLLLAALLTSPLPSCGEGTPMDPAPVHLDLGGGYRGSVLRGERLVVRGAEDRVLLDGLLPSAEADAPSLSGFAVRHQDTDYEMQFGAFKPVETAHGPWRVVRGVRVNQGTLLDGDEALDEGAAAAGETLTRIDLLATDGAVLARLHLTAPDPGHLHVAIEPGDGPERRLSWGFACSADDHFTGFGAQTWDVDHRGQTVPCMVEEQGIGKEPHDRYDGPWFVMGRRHSSHLPIPQYLSRRGYILTAETDGRPVFALCSEQDHAARVELTIPATVHLFDGPDPAQAIERATATFGRPRLPPRVAFAPWLDAIFGSDNVRRVATKLREENIPVSVIWTEDWRGGHWADEEAYRLDEEWEVDRSLYPDFEALADDLHEQGFHLHVYFNPFVYEGSMAWEQTAPHGWLVQGQDGQPYTFTGAKFSATGLIDLDHPDAVAWAVGKMQDAIALGADGWMNDFAEWLPTDAHTHAGPSSIERHNVYPVKWQEVARAAIDGVDDGVERLFFGRSGWFGTPELADVIWAADQRTSMHVDDGLPTIIPMGVGLGLVGISTYGHDIAGYQSATNPGSTKEVFFRWTELGAWSPVMRTHHGAQPPGNWSWEHDEATIDHFRRYAALHMSLVPYFEGLAAQASDNGMPIWRALAIDYPEDAAVWPITDEVLVGPFVLVAPVVTEGATERSVYLPAGRWYPWDVGAPIDGGQRVEVDAPLEHIPAFARAGAIVPTYPPGVMTLVNASAEVPGPEGVGDDRVIYAFLGADGSFSEASGLRYAIVHRADASGDALTLTWGGAPLESCAASPEAPCAQPSPDGATAHVRGTGRLELREAERTLARLEIEGGHSQRRLTIVVRK